MTAQVSRERDISRRTVHGASVLSSRGRESGAVMTDAASQSPSSFGAGDDRVIIKLSPHSVAETVDRFTALIADKGLKLFTVIDHSGEAHNAGLALPDTKVVIFGSPRAGTPVMASRPLAALDLPLKVLVWDDHGQTKVSYTATSELTKRYSLSDELAANLAGIDALTDAMTV
jgi:uncharacterized protein (DUF302 family)